MFTLQLEPNYWWPVHVPEPRNGEWVELVFRAKFVRFDVEGYERFMAELREKKMRDPEVAARVMVDWSDVLSPTGEAVPFSLAALANACRTPGVASNIVKAWMDSQAKVSEKN